LRHPLVTLLLIFCLCWQSLAQAGSAVALADAAELEHAVMHFHGEAHHHHDDHGGTSAVHQDDSAASTQHLLDDACTNAPALMPSVAMPLAPPVPHLLSAADTPPVGSPFLGGLERPPRPHA
jgi:hypothetical protein